ncbi:hypothetical protein ACLB2K_010897 [Fragaria x ananassa]
MVGIGELAAGGAVGLAFTLLYDAASTLVIKTKQFRPLLKELIVTLDYLRPLIKQIEDGHRELDHSNESLYFYFKNQMEKGTRLINKLSKVGTWNLLKPHYSNKLVELDTSICKTIQKLTLEGVRDTQETLALVRSIDSKLKQNELHGQEQNQSGETRATAPYPPFSPIGLDKPLRELKMKLLHDDQVSMLSVTAPGGSGKTTLAQMVCHDQDVKDKFNNMIFFATVSSKPDLIGLQKSLQNFLDQTKENAALLVLDDVWPQSSGNLLEEFYHLSQGSSYKTLVTSRYSSKYGSNYDLDPLTIDEALTLLKNSTSLDYSSGTLDELMEQIVKYCKRFPLAITVVGKSLFKESIEMWKEKVIEWSKGPILEEHTLLRDCLQPSLNVLYENACEDGAIIKECFIDLASLPEDGRIPAGLLIDMWAELRSLCEDRSIVKLQQLNKHNLAKLVVTSKGNENVDSCYSEQFVTQHDLLRELALHQIRQDLEGENKRLNVLPQRLTQKKNKLKETHLLSVSTDGMFSSKWDNVHLPKAEVLILNFQTKDYALPRKMSQELKVLIVRNNGSSSAKISNLKLMSSLTTLKRVRLERISISSKSLNKKKKLKTLEKISLFMCYYAQPASKLNKKKKLKTLEKISLFMCYIAQPASNSSVRFFEALPNLVEINIEYCNDLEELPADLCGFKYLKKLVITNCHNLSSLPEDIGKLSNLEVLRLRSCTKLETSKDSLAGLKNLIFLDISDCFSIKELPKDIGQLSELRKINMRQCERLQELPTSIWDLQDTLKEVICDEETEELWEPFKMIKNLRRTVVKEEFNLRWLLGH